jgi:hypothetical protein
MSIIPPSTRELDSRSSDGLEVQMLWREHDNQVFVVVCDKRSDVAFCLTVHEGERALDVFNHPYAYAARRVPVRPSTVASPPPTPSAT